MSSLEDCKHRVHMQGQESSASYPIENYHLMSSDNTFDNHNREPSHVVPLPHPPRSNMVSEPIGYYNTGSPEAAKKLFRHYVVAMT
jgi:hypothetical protein